MLRRTEWDIHPLDSVLLMLICPACVPAYWAGPGWSLKKLAAERKTAERQENTASSENPMSTIKSFVGKYLCW